MSAGKNIIVTKTPEGTSDSGVIKRVPAGEGSSSGNLIALLQEVQASHGYLPVAALKEISECTGHSMSTVYSVATFYSQFRLKPAGRYTVRVCHGTACHVQGAGAIAHALSEELGVFDGETTSDSLFTLETVACLGCCSLAPVIMIGDSTYGNLTPIEAVRVIRNIRRREGAIR